MRNSMTIVMTPSSL